MTRPGPRHVAVLAYSNAKTQLEGLMNEPSEIITFIVRDVADGDAEEAALKACRERGYAFISAARCDALYLTSPYRSKKGD